ncbi:sushi, nidogen and EGF-like domain-containing protein 1 isoform X4 [Oncorhynchus mykiss]|uniref:sushi, nidogen and EGF-like domain-containing protein 1 isoform X4 n=1 Tax=Oncorhynchus mykiss TaxID=8022 RepID=UPI0018783D44|nr:sushi, nidogen and EGF-like domain-containing protein 1 isoform X4 [Oncorhynchus mykiss]
MDKELVTMRNQMMLFVMFLLMMSKVTTADFVNTSTTDGPSTTPATTSTTDGPSTTPVNTSTTDGPSTSPGPLYPFGAGDTVSSRSDDGSSPPITLEQPFVYFGKPYQQIHVNHNGHLTFNAAFASYIPYRFPAFSSRDLIAPFWTDLDNRRNGTISYRQYSSGSVLQQATQDINQYFPNLGFSVNWVFVATWDKVPYYNTFGTEITFQVVLIAGGQSSFILMNYGEIAPTTQNIQAGYDTVNSIHYFSIPGSFQSNDTTFSYTSNVNVAGRWAFQTNATTSTTDGPSTTPAPTSDEPFAIDDFCIDSIFCKGQGLTGSVYMLSTLLILVFLTILNH